MNKKKIIFFGEPCAQKLSKSIFFDGVNDFFEQGQVTANYNFTAGEDVYIETIFKTNTQGVIQCLLSTQDKNTTTLSRFYGYSYLYRVGGTGTTRVLDFTFVANGNTVVTIRTPQDSFFQNIFYHVALSRRSGVWQYYIDGIAVTTTVLNIASSNDAFGNQDADGTRGLQIGTRRAGNFQEKWNGVISKVIIDNVVPSAAEILRRANRPCCVTEQEYEAAKGAWFFQETSGNLIDFSPNSNNLVPVSLPIYEQLGPCTL